MLGVKDMIVSKIKYDFCPHEIQPTSVDCLSCAKYILWLIARNSQQNYHACVCVLSHFSSVQLFATLWTIACQTPLSMRFSRQEYWSILSSFKIILDGSAGLPSLPIPAWQWSLLLCALRVTCIVVYSCGSFISVEEWILFQSICIHHTIGGCWVISVLIVTVSAAWYTSMRSCRACINIRRGGASSV